MGTQGEYGEQAKTWLQAWAKDVLKAQLGDDEQPTKAQIHRTVWEAMQAHSMAACGAAPHPHSTRRRRAHAGRAPARAMFTESPGASRSRGAARSGAQRLGALTPRLVHACVRCAAAMDTTAEAHLCWSKVTVTAKDVKGTDRQLLRSVNGSASPGSLHAIMGPSGAPCAPARGSS